MIEKLERYIREEDGIKISCPPDNVHIISKINEVIDAVNKQQDIIRQIGEWGSSKGECLWCENLTEVNLDFVNELQIKNLSPCSSAPLSMTNDYTVIKYDELCRLRDAADELARLKGLKGFQN